MLFTMVLAAVLNSVVELSSVSVVVASDAVVEFIAITVVAASSVVVSGKGAKTTALAYEPKFRKKKE